MWWIKATIQEYVLRSWSLVKISANSAQKKLFFKLRQAKSAISALDDGAMRPDQVKTISERLKVTERDVMDMDRRLRGDVSLNSRSNDAIEAGDALDRLVDPSPSHDIEPAETEELTRRRGALEAALQTLSPRERHIFTARYLTETPPNLHTLATEYGISGERIRQIEVRAFQKMRATMLERDRLPTASLMNTPHQLPSTRSSTSTAGWRMSTAGARRSRPRLQTPAPAPPRWCGKGRTQMPLLQACAGGASAS